VGEEDLQTAGVVAPGQDPTDLDGREALTRNTAIMSVGTAMSRVSGFLRVAAAAWALGLRNPLADTYNVANTTPNILYELALGGILSSVFVPVFVQWLDTRGRDEAWEVARRVLTLALVGLTAVALIGMTAGPWIIRAYLIRGSGPSRDASIQLGSYFLRWFMPQVVFYGVGAVATGLLNAHRRFAVPMFAPILNNVSVIATFVVYGMVRASSRPTVITISLLEKAILGAGTTLGVIAMTVILWPSLRSIGFRFRFRWDLRHEAVHQLGRLATWVIVYVIANQVGLLIVIFLSYGSNGYSEFAYAYVLFQLPFAIFAVSIFTALMPVLSARWTAADPQGFIQRLGLGIRTTSVIMLPAAAGYLVLAGPIVRLLLEHGLVRPGAAAATATALQLFAVGLLPVALFQLLTRGFYAMQDARTPGLWNIAANAVNIAMDLVLVLILHLGVGGLALGNSLAYGFGAVALFTVLRSRLGRLEGRALLASATRSLAAAGATAAAAWGASSAVGHALASGSFSATAAQVVAGVVAGFLAFLATALIVRIREVDDVRAMLFERLRT
jgi:putative peptidoglycan lipid II flippase